LKNAGSNATERDQTFSSLHLQSEWWYKQTRHMAVNCQYDDFLSHAANDHHKGWPFSGGFRCAACRAQPLWLDEEIIRRRQETHPAIKGGLEWSRRIALWLPLGVLRSGWVGLARNTVRRGKLRIRDSSNDDRRFGPSQPCNFNLPGALCRN